MCLTLINSTAPPRPNPPTSVTISSVGTTTLTVTWVEPPPNNNISTYDIALTESGGSTITMIVLVGTSTYTFVGLEEYRTYSCVIIATSIYGPLSVPTTAVSSTTLETGKQDYVQGEFYMGEGGPWPLQLYT